MKLPLVLVEWDDAWVRADEPITMADVGSTHQPMVIHTLGWLLRDDDKGISLANEYYDETYRGRTFIPRAMVRKMTTFALTRPRAKREPKVTEVSV